MKTNEKKDNYQPISNLFSLYIPTNVCGVLRKKLHQLLMVGKQEERQEFVLFGWLLELTSLITQEEASFLEITETLL